MILFLPVLYCDSVILNGLSLLNMGTMIGCMFMLLKLLAMCMIPCIICIGVSVPISLAPMSISILSSVMFCFCMCLIVWFTVFCLIMATMFFGDDDMTMG